MSDTDLLPSLLFKINQNQLALEAAIMELTLWVEQRGSAEVVGNVRGALDTISKNEEFINMTLAMLDHALPQRKLVQATAHPRIHVYQAQLNEPDPGDAIDWLENVTGCLGEKLLRSKALICTPEGDFLMQTVGTAFSAPRLLRTKSGGRSVAIFITQDCELHELTRIASSLSIEWEQEAN